MRKVRGTRLLRKMRLKKKKKRERTRTVHPTRRMRMLTATMARIGREKPLN